MTHRTRAGGAAAGLLSLVVLAGCGSSSNSTTSSSTAGAAIDSCLVGSWVSTGVSGTINGKPAQTSGGAGEKITFSNDGSVGIDDSNTSVLEVVAGGQTVGVKQTGQGTGKVTTSAGKVTVTLGSGSTLTTQTLDGSGAPLGTPDAAPTTVTTSYKCTQGQGLELTQTGTSGDSTVSYKPA